MSVTIITRDIKASRELVFNTVADIENFSKAIPHIKEVEFLTESRLGVGTRFRETRDMNGREAVTELEVTEYEENEKVRLVTDSHGTVWDTIFITEDKDGSTLLTLKMDARPHSFLARIMIPLTAGIIKKAIDKDLQAVKEYCEAS